MEMCVTLCRGVCVETVPGGKAKKDEVLHKDGVMGLDNSGTED